MNKLKTPKIIGIILIICGSLYLFFGLISGLYSYTTSNTIYILSKLKIIAPSLQITNIDHKEFKALISTMLLLRKIPIIYKIVTSLLSVLAIISGYKLYHYNAKGKRYANIWATSAIFILITDSILFFTIIKTTTTKFTHLLQKIIQNNKNINELINFDLSIFMTLVQSATVVVTIKHVFSNLALVLLPIITIIMLRSKSVSESLEHNSPNNF